MRGKFRSRSMESIIGEVEQLVSQGVKEISLIAQDSTNYGTDIYDGFMLPTLLNKVTEVPGLAWVRLHYAYPGFFTDELIQTIANNPKVCKYVDMPLQHSEDHILKRMRRPGRQKDVRELITNIRKAIPRCFTAHIPYRWISGRNGRGLCQSNGICSDIQFDRLGVFTYSQEEDTPAARLPDQLPEEMKEWRANTLMEVQREISTGRSVKMVGQTLDVLIERYDGRNDVYIGRTQFDAPEIDGEVFVSQCHAEIGQMVKVNITHAFEYDLTGVAVS